MINRCQIFGRESKHTNKGNKIIFKDKDKLRQILVSYSCNRPVIRCSLKIRQGEGSKAGEGSRKRDPSNYSNEDVGEEED